MEKEQWSGNQYLHVSSNLLAQPADLSIILNCWQFSGGCSNVVTKFPMDPKLEPDGSETRHDWTEEFIRY